MDEYTTEIEQYRNGLLFSTITRPIPKNYLEFNRDEIVEMSEGINAHFKTATKFPDTSRIYVNYYHVFHLPDRKLVYFVPGWGKQRQLWQKAGGTWFIVDEFEPTQQGLILGPRIDDFWTVDTVEEALTGEIVQIVRGMA